MEMTEQGIYDIYGMLHVPWWQTTFFYVTCIVAGIFFFILSIVLCVLWLQRWRKKEELPYWQKAIAELAHAEHAFVQGKISSMVLYELLVRIVKSYLQVQFGSDLLGKTDSELRECIEPLVIAQEYKDQLMELCQTSSTIKFYPAAVAQEHAQKDCQALITFIKVTSDSAEKQ
jgi:hypothetical protein